MYIEIITGLLKSWFEVFKCVRLSSVHQICIFQFHVPFLVDQLILTISGSKNWNEKIPKILFHNVTVLVNQ